MNVCPNTVREILENVSLDDPPDLFELFAGTCGMTWSEARELRDRLLILTRNYVDYISSSDLSTLAKQLGWHVPAELVPSSPPVATTATLEVTTEKARATLLKQIAVLALTLAENDAEYQRGSRPNADRIAKRVIELVSEIEDANIHGLSSASIRQSISDGLALLRK
jgi:hypothetical protein